MAAGSDDITIAHLKRGEVETRQAKTRVRSRPLKRVGASSGGECTTIANAGSHRNERSAMHDGPSQQRRSRTGRRKSALTAKVGDILKNRFELLEVLGMGGMGVVFKALDRRKVEAKDRDPYVAIKLLNDEVRSHPHSYIGFQREATRAQNLTHPNIINVYDFDRDNNQVYMTMEYLRGCSLDVLIKRSKGRPVDNAHSILRDVCAALIHAHANQIAHLDLKPANIFVTRSGRAKVLDFGIAKAMSNARDAGGESAPAKTNLAGLTPAYASREMLKGAAPGAPDDIYALGCVIYELFVGVHPYKRVNAVEAMKEGLEPEPIPALSNSQWKALKKALALPRSERYLSVAEFLQDFDRRAVDLKPFAAGLVVGLLVATYLLLRML